MANDRYLNTIDNYLKDELPDFDLSKLNVSDDEEINYLCLKKYEQKIKRDQKQNIKSKLISVNNGHEEKLLFLRDARDLKDKDENNNDLGIDEKFNFTGIGLNYLIAAKRMLLENKAHASEINTIDFKQLAEDLLAVIHTHSDTKTLAQVISDFLFEKLEPQLGRILHKQDVRTSLEKWAAWSSLEMPTPAVSTIHNFSTSEQKQEIFIQLDVPKTALTNAIKDEWNYARLSKKPKTNKGKFHWFDNGLDDEEKQIARHYANLMLLEDRTGPAQLRDMIPGLKNAYVAFTLRYENKEAESLYPLSINNFITLNQLFHSGTVVYVPNLNQVNQNNKFTQEEIDEEKSRLTTLGLLNQQYITGLMPIHYFTLNSKEADSIIRLLEYVKNLGQGKPDYYGVDSDVVNFTQKAAEKLNDDKIFVSNFCLNEFRRLFVDARPGIDKLEKHIRGFNYNIDKWKKTIAWHQSVGKESHKEFFDCIIQYQDLYNQYFGYDGKGTKLEKIKAQVLDKLGRRLTDIADRRVTNLEEISIISQLLTLKNRILDLNQRLNILDYNRGKTALFVGCASGDNRTGVMLTYTAAVSMGITLHAHMKKFAKAGHTQEMSGTTLCTNGIRGKSLGSFPEAYAPLKRYFLGKAAEIKKLPKPSNLEAKKKKLLNKLNLANTNISLFSQVKNETEQQPFKALKEKIDKHLTSTPYNYKQPSEKYLESVVEYYLDLKSEDDDYKKRLRELDTGLISYNNDAKERIKIEAKRSKLITRVVNFSNVLDTMNEKDNIGKKRVTIEKFKETIPEESRTAKFTNFVKQALALISNPFHFFMYKSDNQKDKKSNRNYRIVDDFKTLTKELNVECERQIKMQNSR